MENLYINVLSLTKASILGVSGQHPDKDLKNDILLSMKAGFNGARLHEKVFEDRFHYWADKLGYITWAEWGNWGANENAKSPRLAFMHEWPKIVEHLKNHPSIITWTPFNETNTLNVMLNIKN